MMKRILSLILVSMMLLTGMMSFGLADLGDYSWAQTQIESTINKDILLTYDGEDFKPETQVTNLEVIVAIYRTLISAGLVEPSTGAQLATKHESTIESLGVPKMMAPYGGDVYPAVGFALENNIIHQAELKYFVDEGQLTTVKKVDASVFIGKAIQIYKTENLQKIFSFDFADSFEITDAAAPYVNLLIESGIIGRAGDSDGKFNPKASINRAVLAVLIDGMYGVVKTGDTGVVVTPETPETTPDDGPVYISGNKGVISDIHFDAKLIEFRDSFGNLKVYDISEADVFLNNKKVSLSSLEVGQNVTISASGDLVQKIEMTEALDGITGEILSISGDFPAPEGVYRVVKLIDEDEKKYFFKLFSTSYVSLDGAEATIDDFKVGDKVTVSVEEYDIKIMDGYSKYYEFNAILTKASNLVPGGSLNVRLDDGSFIDKALSKSVKLSSTGDGFNRDDIVTVVYEYGEVVSVKAIGQSAVEKGTITKILISSSPSITIKDDDGDTKTHKLSSNVVFKDAEDQLLTIYDLRLNQYVELNIGAGGVIEVKFSQAAEHLKFSGTIVERHPASNLLMVTDTAGKKWVVVFSSGSDLSIDDYAVNDKVFVWGYKQSEDVFEADLMIVID